MSDIESLFAGAEMKQERSEIEQAGAITRLTLDRVLDIKQWKWATKLKAPVIRK
jgi:hypothetical protein